MAPAALAALPILIVFIGMLGLRWSAAGAGLAGLVAAGAIVISGIGPLPVSAPAVALLMTGSFAEALFTTTTILWIIFPALCIYELQTRTGAFDAIRVAISGVTDDRRLLVLLIAWFFGLFVEGAAGFGTPVALAAPLLVGLGVDPVRAVALTLIGHAAGVSFGAVGTPIGPQLVATMLPAIELSRATALFHVTLGWILLAFLVKLADSTPPRRKDWLWAFAAGACFMTPYLLLASMIGPELPTLGGALIGSLLFLALVRRACGKKSTGRSRDWCEIVKAIAPYLALLVLVLATRLISGLRDALTSVSWAWSLGDIFGGSAQPLYHPGTMLLVAFLIGSVAQRTSVYAVGQAALGALRRLAPVALALIVMLCMARIMVHGGLANELAESAALTGAAWPLFAPAVGALGTFVTGSATASNILFTDFQASAAERLGLPLVPLVAAQGFGAAVGNIVCPHNIVAGSATVGVAGREGEVLRMTAAACAVYAIAGGALVFLWLS